MGERGKSEGEVLGGWGKQAQYENKYGRGNEKKNIGGINHRHIIRLGVVNWHKQVQIQLCMCIPEAKICVSCSYSDLDLWPSNSNQFICQREHLCQNLRNSLKLLSRYCYQVLCSTWSTGSYIHFLSATATYNMIDMILYHMISYKGSVCPWISQY